MFVDSDVGPMYYDVKPSVFPVHFFRFYRFGGQPNSGVFDNNPLLHNCDTECTGFGNEFSIERCKNRNPRLGATTSGATT